MEECFLLKELMLEVAKNISDVLTWRSFVCCCKETSTLKSFEHTNFDFLIYKNLSEKSRMWKKYKLSSHLGIPIEHILNDIKAYRERFCSYEEVRWSKKVIRRSDFTEELVTKYFDLCFDGDPHTIQTLFKNENLSLGFLKNFLRQKLSGELYNNFIAINSPIEEIKSEIKSKYKLYYVSQNKNVTFELVKSISDHREIYNNKWNYQFLCRHIDLPEDYFAENFIRIVSDNGYILDNPKYNVNRFFNNLPDHMLMYLSRRPDITFDHLLQRQTLLKTWPKNFPAKIEDFLRYAKIKGVTITEGWMLMSQYVNLSYVAEDLDKNDSHPWDASRILMNSQITFEFYLKYFNKLCKPGYNFGRSAHTKISKIFCLKDQKDMKNYDLLWRHYFTDLEQIYKTREKWNWTLLSKIRKIQDVVTRPTYPWNTRVVSERSDVTPDIVLSNKNFPWCFVILSNRLSIHHFHTKKQENIPEEKLWDRNIIKLIRAFPKKPWKHKKYILKVYDGAM